MSLKEQVFDIMQKARLLRVEQDAPPKTPRGSAPRRVEDSPSLYASRYSSARGDRTAAPRAKNAKPARTRAIQTVTERQSKPVSRPDTMVYYISSLSECAAVIRDIIAGVSAVINFDGTDARTSQRIIDTVAGAAFALNAKVRKITDNTYIIAPESVNVNMSRHVERRY